MDGQTGLDRRTFFKGAGLVGASLAVPSLLSACGGEGAGATGGAQKLEFWWNPSVESADQMTAWMNGVIKEFTAANKGTSIESTTQPSEQMVGNFRTACQSQSRPRPPPRVLGSVHHAVRLGELHRPAGRHPTPSRVRPRPAPAALNLYKFQGKTWALPWYNAPVALMYNKALFTAAGLDPEKPPTTVDELISAAAKRKASGVDCRSAMASRA